MCDYRIKSSRVCVCVCVENYKTLDHYCDIHTSVYIAAWPVDVG